MMKQKNGFYERLVERSDLSSLVERQIQEREKNDCRELIVVGNKEVATVTEDKGSVDTKIDEKYLRKKLGDLEDSFQVRAPFDVLYSRMKEFEETLGEAPKSRIDDLDVYRIESLVKNSDSWNSNSLDLVCGRKVQTVPSSLGEMKGFRFESDGYRYPYSPVGKVKGFNPIKSGAYTGIRNKVFPVGSIGKIIGFHPFEEFPIGVVVQFEDSEVSEIWSGVDKVKEWPLNAVYSKKEIYNVAHYTPKELKIVPMNESERNLLGKMAIEIKDLLEKKKKADENTSVADLENDLFGDEPDDILREDEIDDIFSNRGSYLRK
jgi:hypothetical protein